jgi:hypothetical protein
VLYLIEFLADKIPLGFRLGSDSRLYPRTCVRAEVASAFTHFFHPVAVPGTVILFVILLNLADLARAQRAFKRFAA